MEWDNPLSVDLQLEVAFNSAPAPKQVNASGGDACVFSVELSTGSKGVPHIFSPAGGRRREAIVIDRRLHGANVIPEYMRVLSQCIANFDAGNVVVALSQAAKIVDEAAVPKLKAQPLWQALLDNLMSCVGELEPRGLSMAAYDCAKLGCREEAVLSALASASTRRAQDFGGKDIAKMCWAIAKTGLRDGEVFEDFWAAMEAQVPAKVHDGNVADVSMIAWSFATMEIGAQAMYHETALALLAMSSDIPPQSLSNIVWAYASMGFYDSTVAAAVCARAITSIDAFVEFDMSDLCWGLARMNAVDYPLFDQLATHIAATGLWKRLPAMHASQVAWAFASARFLHIELFDALSEYISRHVAVFDTQHVAMFAWAFAATGAPATVAFTAIALHAKGGKLWNFMPDQLCALFWAFSKIRWHDEQLFWDLVQVAGSRRNEFNGDCLANLLWSLTTIRTEQFVDSSGFQDEIEEMLNFILEALRNNSVSLSDAETLAMAVWAFCKLGRLQDASSLLACLAYIAWQPPTQPSSGLLANFASPLRCYSVLLLESQRLQDARWTGHIWKKMAAQATDCRMRMACLNSSLLAFGRAGHVPEAKQVLELLEGFQLSNLVSMQLAQQLGICGGSVPSTAESSGFLPAEKCDSKHLHYEVEMELFAALLDVSMQNADSIVDTMFEGLARLEEDRFEIAMQSHMDVLEDILLRHQPRTVVDLNAQAGYFALRIALQMQSFRSDGQVFALEEDPVRAAVLQNLCEVAGLAGCVSVLSGPIADCLPVVAASLNGASADLVLLHNTSGARLLADLQTAECLGVIAHGCNLMVDHVLRPGAPELLWHMASPDGYAMELVAVSEHSDAHDLTGADDDWMLVGHACSSSAGICRHCLAATGNFVRRPQEGCAMSFSKLAALRAESDNLWRHLLTQGPATGPLGRRLQQQLQRFAKRASAEFASVGISPTRRMPLRWHRS